MLMRASNVGESDYWVMLLLKKLVVSSSWQCFNVMDVSSKKKIMLAHSASLVLLSMTFYIVLHYYVTVFHRAMAQKSPGTCLRFHGVYCLGFGILFLLTNIRHGKKGYVNALVYNAHKKK